MKNNKRWTLLLVLVCGLAVVLLMMVGPALNGPQENLPAAGELPASADQAPLDQEAVTPTPLPTLVLEENPPSLGQMAGVGLMLVCSMIGLMVVGIFAATLMVRLRQRVRD